MSTAIVIDGWKLSRGHDGNATVLDEELGAHLEFSRPRDVRKLVERMLASGMLNDSDVRATVARQVGGWGGARKSVTEYHLTRVGCLLVTTQSETPKAIEITRQIVTVFDTVTAGGHSAAAPLPLDIAHGIRLRDEPRLRLEMQALCGMTARATARSLQYIYGWVRRTYRVGSPFDVAAAAWPAVKDTLQAIALGKQILPGKPARLRLPADRRQVELPFQKPN